jgi:CheY-like chemotaxis protein
MRILIAEDDRPTRRVLETLTLKWGYTPVACGDGRDARQKLLEGDPPRLALLDWRMPHISGVDLCRLIRSCQAEGSYTYVILLTAESERPRRLEAFDAGVDDFITKPFCHDELGARIRAGQRVLDLYGEIREIYRAAPVAMLLLDDQGNVRRMNHAARVLTGDAEDLLLHRPDGLALRCVLKLGENSGDPCGDTDPIARCDCTDCDLREMILRTLHSRVPEYRREVHIRRPDSKGGEEVCFLASSAPVKSCGENLLLVSLEDVTRQYRTEQRLQRTVAELEAFNKIAIGRELRMIELKRQINDLCRRLDLQSPHDLSFAGEVACGLPRSAIEAAETACEEAAIDRDA